MGTPPEQAGDDGLVEEAAVLQPPGEAAAWPGPDAPAPEVDAGDGDRLPFELYAPGWQAGWGRALRAADPR